ncbi:MAG: metallophosphoesterase family protein [Pseudomonadota bacterium]
MFEGMLPKRNSKPKIGPGRRVYAIGDIHGRYDLFRQLISAIDADLAAKPIETPEIVILGDFIDRGPASQEVVDYILHLKSQRDVIVLKGNHEAALLSFLEDPVAGSDWLDWGGAETLESYGVSDPMTRPADALVQGFMNNAPREHRALINTLPLTYEAGDFFFVHAGVKPGVALEEQEERDLLWIRGSFHKAPANERPDKIIVHGHHPTKRPVDKGWRVGIDTGAVWSGRLTAVAIDDTGRRFIETGS